MFSLKASSPVFSLHSRQFRTAQVQTRRRHWRRIPPEDMFFSASRSAKLSEDAKIRTSAITTSLWRKEMATSMGIPWVGSSTSNSFWKKKIMEEWRVRNLESWKKYKTLTNELENFRTYRFVNLKSQNSKKWRKKFNFATIIPFSINIKILKKPKIYLT